MRPDKDIPRRTADRFSFYQYDNAWIDYALVGM